MGANSPSTISAVPPRMMSDAELRGYFGLSDRALRMLKGDRQFPRKDALVGKTDRKAVDFYFDRRSGLPHPSAVDNVVDGQEEF